MIIMPSKMTHRELLFAGLALGSLAAFVGCLVAHSVRFDPVYAAPIVALAALIVATLGYVDNRRSQILTHRAYVRLNVIEVTVEPRQKLGFKMVALNYGKTPAHRTAINTKVHLVSAGTRIDTLPKPEIKTHRVYTIHPGEDDKTLDWTGSFVVSTDQINAVLQGQADLVVLAACTYYDAYGKKRHTNMATYVKGWDTKVLLTACDTGNDCD